MFDENHLRRYDSSPTAVRLAPRLLAQAAIANSVAEFLNQTLSLLRQTTESRYVALVRGERGKWTPMAESGTKQPLPIELLADVLDRDSAAGGDEWIAAPLIQRSGGAELLLVHRPQLAAAEAARTVDALAGLLGTALRVARQREDQQQRILRLEAILEIAAQWNQTLEMDTLLNKIAEASTRLLAAERASIFLWDRASKTIVGRPALGVEQGELRIPDNTGVVGQVIHSGEPRRVDAGQDDAEIDRRVDRQLGFRTRNLLCVPMCGKRGDLLGAFEMINKREGNFSEEDEAALTDLAHHAAIALENTQQYEHLLQSRNQLANQAAQTVRLIGQCPAIEALRGTVRRVAETDLAVLILGENGTGKEVVSQMIHYLSRRRNEPFVAVNCAALTETLLESELFGHEKGAFTDAREMRAGKFELASGGTLFLDEIGDMSLSGQAKMLRVLEEKVVVRVGGSTPIHTDARVFAATNQNLVEMVRAKRFREDLYFRLNVVTLELPPLRDRGDDVLLLAEHFLREFCAKARRRMPKFTAAARKRLLGHSWPGNVRELRNLTERLAYLSPDDTIDADDLAFIFSPTADAATLFPLDLSLADATKRFQTQFIKQQIEATRGNMTDAAQRLGLHRSNLYRKMRQLDLPVDET
jgi:Nif-specific regulatory protein